MSILKNLRNVAIAILPIIIAVVIIDLFVFDIGVLWHFLLGAGMLLVGETLVLSFIDESVVKMGALVAYSSRRRNGMFMVAIFALIFGILSTIAEPDMQVLAGEVSVLGLGIPKFVFVLVAGLGIGIFCVIGLVRPLIKIPLWFVMILFYGAVVAIMFFAPKGGAAFAFDAGSASTGLVAAPFLIALCSGIGARQAGGGKDNSFGLIGVTSIGPVLAILILMFVPFKNSGVVSFGFELGNIFADSAISVALAVVPMIIVFFVFELSFFRISKQENYAIVCSTILLIAGLFLMIAGLEFGFVGVGKNLGRVLGEKNLWWIVLILGGVFGFFFTFAEPAVRVLGDQVEERTNGNIKSRLVVFAIAISMVISFALVTLTVVFEWNIAYVLVAVLGIALLLMIFSPSIFVGISFDSGGVALGPSSSSFLFPMILGLSGALSAETTFGTLALLGLVPCVVLQVIGIAYGVKAKTLFPAIMDKRKRAASGIDRYSEIDDLQNMLKKKYGVKND